MCVKNTKNKNIPLENKQLMSAINNKNSIHGKIIIYLDIRKIQKTRLKKLRILKFGLSKLQCILVIHEINFVQ